MTEKQTSQSTVITLVLPSDNSHESATLHIQHGDIDHTDTFTCEDFGDICRALNNSLKNISQGQPSEEPVPDESESTTEIVSVDTVVCSSESEGTPPYHLQTPDGKVRTLTMLDPFNLQERYHKTNRNYQFDQLNEALSVARALVAAGENDVLHVLDAGGHTVQNVSTEAATKSAEDTEAEAPPDDPGYPDDIDSEAKRAMYDILHDETQALQVCETIHKVRKHSWKQHLSKQREVKRAIHDTLLSFDTTASNTAKTTEALYTIAYRSTEFDDLAMASDTSDVADDYPKAPNNTSKLC